MKRARKWEVTEQVFVACIVLLFTGLGSWGLFWSIGQISLSEQSRHWPHTTGRVTRSEVEVTHSKTTSFWPQVGYKYRVGGQIYRNSIIQFGQNGSARLEDAEATVSRYPVATQPQVYYKPTAPQVSCLEPGTLYWATYLAFPLCLFLLLFGLVWAVFLLTSIYSRPKANSSKA
jgi:hypothetical protein